MRASSIAIAVFFMVKSTLQGCEHFRKNFFFPGSLNGSICRADLRCPCFSSRAHCLFTTHEQRRTVPDCSAVAPARNQTTQINRPVESARLSPLTYSIALNQIRRQ